MEEWICSCGQKNTSKFCTRCGSIKPENLTDSQNNSWVCSCGNVNTSKFCTVCGKPQTAAKLNISKTENINSEVKSSAYQKTETTKPSENKKNHIIIALVCVIGVLIVSIGYLITKSSSNDENSVGSRVVNSEEKNNVNTETAQESKSVDKVETPKVETKPSIKPLGEHWISDANGVYLWNPQPTEGETITWSGGYVQDGAYKYAEGFGIVTWYDKSGKAVQIDEGTFTHGQRQGKMKHQFLRSGKTEYINWNNGVEIKEVSPQIRNAEVAKQTFINYHRAITNKNYREAYNILSSSQQQLIGNFESYVNGFANTISSEVSDISLVSNDENSYTFDYILTARDYYQGGRIKIQIFKGQVVMANKNGSWYVQYAQSSKVSERIE